jgi:hypothetical protein
LVKPLDKTDRKTYNTVTVSTLKDTISDELGYELEVRMDAVNGKAKFVFPDLKVTIEISITSLVPYLQDDKAMKEFVLKYLKSKLFN